MSRGGKVRPGLLASCRGGVGNGVKTLAPCRATRAVTSDGPPRSQCPLRVLRRALPIAVDCALEVSFRTPRLAVGNTITLAPSLRAAWHVLSPLFARGEYS